MLAFTHLSSVQAFVRYYLKPYWKSILVSGFCILCLGFLQAMMAILVGPSVQALLFSKDNQVLSLLQIFGLPLSKIFTWLGFADSLQPTVFFRALPILLLCCALVKTLLQISQFFTWERLSEKMACTMRQDILVQYLKMAPYHQQKDAAFKSEEQLATILTTDVKMLREFLVHYYGGIPRELMQVVFMMATLFFISSHLSLVFFLGILPAFALIRYLGRKVQKRAQSALQNYTQLSEWLQQRLLGTETIKQYRTENFEVGKMRSLNEKLFSLFYKAARSKTLVPPVMETVAISALALVVWIALGEMFKGNLSSAMAMSFFTSLAFLSQSAQMLGRYFNSNREGASCAERIIATYKELKSVEKEDLHQKIIPASASSPLTLHGLDIAYSQSSKKILEGFSYAFEKGKIYCLVGPSGTGKSTLFKTILGLLDPLKGQIAMYSSSGVSSIGYVPQTTELFAASLAQNISYPEEQYDVARVEEALRVVGLEDAIKSMKDGINTQVGSGGRGFSGGQKQRLHLARIYYHNYPLILMDEGTSALDGETESLVYSFLRQRATEGSTVLLIAHRPSAPKYADCIVSF